ncbi:MAG TPA: imidazole glycerol phosphate synthase subunit HisH [Opitutae bacterium]|nr:imidazole glycerol phosphate synthase subunit HisH [Puniceicoccaceae bacterium]HBR94198.1 imidazole glycerol phosphate synthase subunit HisH [Opitutae bacterium]|tara:strand:- start:5737 stop:6360 length:624 start_codon:yes stop_codon:yes gene_type:complete
MAIGIINYGMGNIASIKNAFEALGADTFLVETPEMLKDAERIILPGVGAFSAAMQHLNEEKWIPAIQHAVYEQKRPLLGICLGMQLLLTSGDEGGTCAGLGLIDGEVKHLQLSDPALRIPHMGWNEVDYTAESPLFKGIPDQSDFYFVHSYAAVTKSDDDVIARTQYGGDFVVAIARDHVFGVQFHPEKSSTAGRKLLQNFLEYMPC